MISRGIAVSRGPRAPAPREVENLGAACQPDMCCRGTMRGQITVEAALRLAASSVFLLLVFGACGDGDDAPPPAVVPPDPCVPHFAAAWTPTWHPPRAPREGACTRSQIDAQYTTCHSASGSQAACEALRANAANKACADCLFTDEKEATYGPIIWSPNSWRTNTGGCIASLDRDMTAQGCGARVDAATECADAACRTCEPFNKFLECRRKANATVCRAHYLDSICQFRPEYTTCTDYETNQEYFEAVVNAFCVAGPTMTSVNSEGAWR